MTQSLPPKTPRARTARCIVGVLFAILPFMLTFAIGLWAESTRPWISPLELDETLMPLPSLAERCVNAVFSGSMAFTLPIMLSGPVLYVQRVSVDSLVFCALGLMVYSVLLVILFGNYVYALGAPVPAFLRGVSGLWGLAGIPILFLSGLLFTLGKERYVRWCALLPLVICGGLLLISSLIFW